MKVILESPEHPYFIEYRGDWELRVLKSDTECIQRAASEYIHLYRIIDLSDVYSKWKEFVYSNIPNNWLKMHGYPMRRKR